MTTKDVSKFNFWANNPKDTQPTRTLQDVNSEDKIRRIEFSAICCPCSGCDN